MDCIHLAKDTDQWRAVVNTVLNIRFHKMLVNLGVTAQLAASEEGLSSMELVSLLHIAITVRQIVKTCHDCFLLHVFQSTVQTP
jgi:hypothetical protein